MGTVHTVAIIGCGHRGREHAIALAADARCKVVALADVKEESAHLLAAELAFSDAKVYVSHKVMLAETHPDVVVIALWPAYHLPVFRDAATLGVKAVMCEKPMALTWSDSLEMAKIARDVGCQLTFCHQRRFARGNLWVRRQLAVGTFGNLERMDLYSPPNLLDCGTHTIDQAMSFNRESPPKWVLGGIDTTELITHFGAQSEAMAIGTIVFENGVRATLQIGGPDMDLWGGVRVVGSKGFVEVLWDGQIVRAIVYDDPKFKIPATDENSSAEQMVTMVRHVIDCLESGSKPDISVEHALPVMEVMFGLYESVRSHRRINLPLKNLLGNPFISMLESGTFGSGSAD